MLVMSIWQHGKLVATTQFKMRRAVAALSDLQHYTDLPRASGSHGGITYMHRYEMS